MNFKLSVPLILLHLGVGYKALRTLSSFSISYINVDWHEAAMHQVCPKRGAGLYQRNEYHRLAPVRTLAARD